MSVSERDPSSKKDTIADFVARRKRQAELKQARREDGAKAFDMLDKFWGQFDMDDIDQRIKDYQAKSKSGFRVHLSGLTFIPGAYQYPFVEVKGKKLAIRELVEGEGRRDPPGSGRITGYSLVVADEALPGPDTRDRDTGDIAGEAVYATIQGGDIQYSDELINNDVELSHKADQEVLGYLEGVQEGMMKMLGSPEPVTADEN